MTLKTENPHFLRMKGIQIFNLLVALKLHVAKDHEEGKKAIKCDISHTSFSLNNLLKSHIEAVHERKNLL